MKSILSLFVISFLVVGSANAEVLKNIRIESKPPGAEVFLLQGSRETLVGKTPLNYRAEFHSELSILRMAVKKTGYESKKFEINTKDPKLVLTLEKKRMLASAQSLNDKSLQAIQADIAAKLEKLFPRLLANQTPFQVELVRPVSVVRIDQSVYLQISISVAKQPDGPKLPDSNQLEQFSAAVWNQFGDQLILPLAKELRNESRIHALLLDVDYSKAERGFSVGTRMETVTEMQCVGGMKSQSVYDPCASMESVSTFGGRYMEQRCKGGFVNRQVYDPCAQKVPVFRTEIKADPKVFINAGESRLRYFADRAMMAGSVSASAIYPKIDRALYDKKGKLVEATQGVPKSLKQ